MCYQYTHNAKKQKWRTKMVTFGEKSWEDEAAGNSQSDFYNMKDNKQYTVRIVGKPHEFAAHWVEAPGLGKKKVNCAGKGCVICSKGLKPSVRYFIPIIVRDEKRVAVTEFGPQVYGHIRALFKNSNWGNPMGYDITIDKNTNRGAAGTYFVTPVAKTDFSAEEKAKVKEFNERIDLRELSAPLTNDAIIEKLGMEYCSKLGIASKSTSASSKPSEEFADFGSESDSESEDDDYNFSN
jgi:hypothetical protein